MSQEFLSVAIWQPLPGMEAASVATIREISQLIASRNYGHDVLYLGADSHYILLRCWNSREAQQTAMEDPELLRRWAKLGNEIRTLKVFEKVESVDVEGG
ncbi:MAG TPA: hypothetical protein VND65_10335 [Candidatus Binatia bacterium]|nr:hypothetical protein [Candidatus Binatia bacterium]